MIFQLIILGLILGLTVFLLVEGLYTALIMALCSVFSLAVAFNFAEPLAASLRGVISESADAVALGVLFLIPLGALRFLADRFLSGMVHMPYWVDRIGGAAFGAVSALILTGVLVLCLKLLPFGPAVLGYRGFTSGGGPTSPPVVQSLWLSPDSFTIGLVNVLSSGSMSGDQPFARVHPDYQREVAGFAQVRPYSRPHAVADALGMVQVPTAKGPKTCRAAGAWVTVPARFPKGLPPDQAEEKKLRLFRVSIQPKVLAKQGMWLSGGQVQLTARRTDAEGKPVEGGPTRLVFPGWVVVQADNQPEKREPFGVDRVWRVKSAEEAKSALCRMVFVLPKDFAPWFLTVKRHTRVPVTMIGEGAEVSASVGPGGGIAMAGIGPTVGWEKSVSAKLPIPLRVKGPATGAAETNVSGAGVELAAGRLVRARLQGKTIGFTNNPGGRAVTEFATPAGHRIVQLEGRAQSDRLLAFWPDLLAVEVRAAGKSIPLAGVALTAKGDQRLLFYDRDRGAERFEGANIEQFIELGGQVEKVHLVMIVPSSAKKLTLQVGDGHRISVTLPK